ncbi:hypothetical protein TOPH_05522 [Tolypocladium ophioglossoides CBS 100239]|uniref:gamma-glutamylcyclotransferase n=1 Tax=Tolypocladium ophioglossoides (strain CBS 100239) TaxID=1163406 RepID=A0A0L0N722_TOLOC|nr:hypothetical protein TOPH_05522 [Tolypocladium ophioglossoides CBS 100239]
MATTTTTTTAAAAATTTTTAAAAAAAAATTTRPGADPRPTKYYFAYGSNLHVKQMKRRCPNSRYIGRARLADYRWQINERGYANVVAAEGRWVDGLVYEIDDKDEAKLDINEGVSKNAYEKRYMSVLLHRAHGAIYRRPVSWIVDKGGPAAVCRQSKNSERGAAGPSPHWENHVLVYVSFNHVQDSAPKHEYVNRLNLGIADARALGIEEDYIRNCIRPLISEPPDGHQEHSSAETRGKSAARGVKRSSSPRTGERSPARKGQVLSRPDEQTPHRALARTTRSASSGDIRARGQASGVRSPSAPVRRFHDVPIITVEEHVYISGWEWRSAV